MKIIIIRKNASVFVHYMILNVHMRSKVHLKLIKVIYKFNNRCYVLIINCISRKKCIDNIVNIISSYAID